MIQTTILFYKWLAFAILLEVHNNAYTCFIPDYSLSDWDKQLHYIAQEKLSDAWFSLTNEIFTQIFKNK